MNEAAFWWLQF